MTNHRYEYFYLPVMRFAAQLPPWSRLLLLLAKIALVLILLCSEFVQPGDGTVEAHAGPVEAEVEDDEQDRETSRKFEATKP